MQSVLENVSNAGRGSRWLTWSFRLNFDIDYTLTFNDLEKGKWWFFLQNFMKIFHLKCFFSFVGHKFFSVGLSNSLAWSWNPPWLTLGSGVPKASQNWKFLQQAQIDEIPTFLQFWPDFLLKIVHFYTLMFEKYWKMKNMQFGRGLFNFGSVWVTTI